MVPWHKQRPRPIRTRSAVILVWISGLMLNRKRVLRLASSRVLLTQQPGEGFRDRSSFSGSAARSERSTRRQQKCLAAGEGRQCRAWSRFGLVIHPGGVRGTMDGLLFGRVVEKYKFRFLEVGQAARTATFWRGFRDRIAIVAQLLFVPLVHLTARHERRASDLHKLREAIVALQVEDRGRSCCDPQTSEVGGSVATRCYACGERRARPREREDFLS